VGQRKTQRRAEQGHERQGEDAAETRRVGSKTYQNTADDSSIEGIED
jgi:hypothetical protein